MLALTLRVGETLYIGDNIKVKVLAKSGRQIKVGIDAPRNISVDRESVRERKLSSQNG